MHTYKQPYIHTYNTCTYTCTHTCTLTHAMQTLIKDARIVADTPGKIL